VRGPVVPGKERKAGLNENEIIDYGPARAFIREFNN
jgi:hypothetical protein